MIIWNPANTRCCFDVIWMLWTSNGRWNNIDSYLWGEATFWHKTVFVLIFFFLNNSMNVNSFEVILILWSDGRWINEKLKTNLISFIPHEESSIHSLISRDPPIAHYLCILKDFTMVTDKLDPRLFLFLVNLLEFDSFSCWQENHDKRYDNQN